MKTFCCALLALALPVGTAAAADKPNFSGDWNMNAAKSSFGVLPAPDSMSRKIAHSEPSIAIDEEQLTPLGVQKTLRKYTTDGKEMSFESQGTQVTSKATWDGNVLIVLSNVAEAGLQFTDRMTLSEDGKTLTSDVHLATPQGDVDLKVVFDKK